MAAVYRQLTLRPVRLMTTSHPSMSRCQPPSSRHPRQRRATAAREGDGSERRRRDRRCDARARSVPTCPDPPGMTILITILQVDEPSRHPEAGSESIDEEPFDPAGTVESIREWWFDVNEQFTKMSAANGDVRRDGPARCSGEEFGCTRWRSADRRPRLLGHDSSGHRDRSGCQRRAALPLFSEQASRLNWAVRCTALSTRHSVRCRPDDGGSDSSSR